MLNTFLNINKRNSQWWMDNSAFELQYAKKVYNKIKNWQVSVEELVEYTPACKLRFDNVEQLVIDTPVSFDFIDCTYISKRFDPLDTDTFIPWQDLFSPISTQKIDEFSDYLLSDSILHELSHEQLRCIIGFSEVLLKVTKTRINYYRNRIRLCKRNLNVLKRDVRGFYRSIIRFLFKNMEADLGDDEALFIKINKQFSSTFYLNHNEQLRNYQLYN